MLQVSERSTDQKFDRLKNQQKPETEIEHQITVINLSSKTISEATNSTLAKGLNFAISLDRIPMEEMIVSVEAAIRNLSKQAAKEIQIDISQILWKVKQPAPNTTAAKRRVLKELRADQELVILPADKGETTRPQRGLQEENDISSLRINI
ncbi:hypothetical protein J437_LFUL013360 [Ladona fulva]|uniref:Uncharacterized protein n=1 Tax=Ladona fulva TaxID=123851 RepID=A0A8K0P7E9_LADFU|nr:hypothetical protein J437_LFUL013360 [Ladona fulva]